MPQYFLQLIWLTFNVLDSTLLLAKRLCYPQMLVRNCLQSYPSADVIFLNIQVNYMDVPCVHCCTPGMR